MTAPVFLAPPSSPPNSPLKSSPNSPSGLSSGLSSGALAAVQPGDRYILTGDEGRHARVVQRLQAGELVDIVDGSGLRLRCEVVPPDGLGKDVLSVTVLSRTTEPNPVPALTLVQALAKGEASELAIAQAVEVGVSAIQPWQSERAIVIWRGERAAKSAVKWETAVSRAAKQARRALVPPVRPVVTTPELATLVQRTVQADGAAFVLDGAASASLADVPLPTTGEILVIVGPEGGISADEIARLTAAGAVSVTAGPHIMRSSTAGAVATAALMLRLGRWGAR